MSELPTSSPLLERYRELAAKFKRERTRVPATAMPTLELPTPKGTLVDLHESKGRTPVVPVKPPTLSGTLVDSREDKKPLDAMLVLEPSRPRGTLVDLQENKRRAEIGLPPLDYDFPDMAQEQLKSRRKSERFKPVEDPDEIIRRGQIYESAVSEGRRWIADVVQGRSGPCAVVHIEGNDAFMNMPLNDA